MIARHHGAIVFVSGAIPGEVVEAEIEKTQRGTAWATTTNVIERSPDRVDGAPDGACGGSVFAHIAYARQRYIKSEIITDAFRRVGKLTLDASTEVAESPIDGYRMRARLHMRGGRIGFFREGTHSLCDAASTRQLSAGALEVIRALEVNVVSAAADAITDIELSENISGSERALHLELRPDGDASRLASMTRVDDVTGATCSHAGNPRTIDLFGSPYVADTIAGATLQRHARSFFQGNRFLTPALVEYVLSQIARGAILDLYAGVGLFSVTAANRGLGRVSAVEGDRWSSADLTRNAQEHDVIVKAGAVESVLRQMREQYDTVIVDPPRTGMSKEALAGALAIKSARIVYVSCDVATLARDARVIVDAGYQIQSMRAFDLFPNTAHVETVISFAR